MSTGLFKLQAILLCFSILTVSRVLLKTGFVHSICKCHLLKTQVPTVQSAFACLMPVVRSAELKTRSLRRKLGKC